jgi:HrpA-like RNA helicase
VLSLLPVDVHTGKLLVLGGLLGLQEPAITMAAALAVQSPFVRLTDSQQEAGVLERRRELMSPWGDAFTLLEVRGWALALARRAALLGRPLAQPCRVPALARMSSLGARPAPVAVSAAGTARARAPCLIPKACPASPQRHACFRPPRPAPGV